MLTLQLHDVKDFMAKLLIADTFHPFLVKEALITTFNTFSIDGRLHKDFFTAEELESGGQSDNQYSRWEDLKNICFALIKGSKSPRELKITFCYDTDHIAQFLTAQGLPLAASDIAGLYLHIVFSNNILRCTTGTSLKVFVPDKSLDHAWDDYVQQLFKLQQIPFELI